MASQTGTILVTGANGGLGSAIVGHVIGSNSLARDLHGLYAVRNTQRADAVQKELQKAGPAGHKYDLVPLDLSSLASTRKAAQDINKRVADGSIPPIRALVLSAAWQEYTTHTITDDGFDMTFQATYLSHFLLTLLLLRSMDKKHGRVVVLASWSHDTADKRNTMGPPGNAYSYERYNQIFKEPMDTESLARGKWSSAEEHPDNLEAGYRRYGAAKLCEVMFMRELSKRITKDPDLSSIAVLALDPGAMPTSLGTRGSFGIRALFALMNVVNPIMSYIQPDGDMRTTALSASHVMRASLDTETLGERPNGVYLDGTRAREVSEEAKDEAKCRKLWEDTLDFAQVQEGDTVLVDWR
ncbi:Uu.00g067220.m01.CDS01 [Anthostomella pinea]|uniref:Uu.00g067220.m01.CDS01 n=1 Tax=Anthostomella pinea TaxID=933095 RepID=A0AAI8VU28_9PEZI|nr:Uu.00g067220.m01.CDS01 [Anthostomella pinea]